VIFIEAIFSENFVSSFIFLFLSLALNSFFISNFSSEISAKGSPFIILNASLRDVCIFLAFVPGIAMHVSSFVSLCPISAISAMSDVAYFAAQIRFRLASVEARSIDLCENVRAIGLFGFCMKNESAAAV
jgi:hypothetical protein